MAEDKKTIGLTELNKNVMDQIVEKAGFGNNTDAAKFAFAFAVSRGCEPTQVEGAGTIWAAGNFDEGGELKALIQNLYPSVSETPYRALEALMNAGFTLLASELKAKPSLRIEELLKQDAETSAV